MEIERAFTVRILCHCIRDRIGIAGCVTVTIFAADVPGFQQRVFLQRLGNECFDFQIGRGQQADRLLQLRRHHQRLRLPEIKTGAECHYIGSLSLGSMSGREPCSSQKAGRKIHNSKFSPR